MGYCQQLHYYDDYIDLFSWDFQIGPQELLILLFNLIFPSRKACIMSFFISERLALIPVISPVSNSMALYIIILYRGVASRVAKQLNIEDLRKLPKIRKILKTS